jgi:arylsulfatase A-like enzyme
MSNTKSGKEFIPWRVREGLKKATEFISEKKIFIKDIPYIFSFSGKERINVIIITIDSLRADFICNPVVKTPNLNKLAKEGVHFLHALTNYTQTYGSHLSLFTGNFPFRYSFHSKSLMTDTRVYRHIFSVLYEYGWRILIYKPKFVLPFIGPDMGYEYEILPYQWSNEKRKSLLKAIKSLERGKKNYFFFLWFLDCHYPYGSTKYKQDDLVELIRDNRGNEVRELYKKSVERIDKFLGEIFSLVSDNTLVIVLGDHGEYWGENLKNNRDFHYQDFHSSTTFDAVLKPALIMKGTTLPKNIKVNSQVRLIDIYPTILEIFGITLTWLIDGKSLLPVICGKEMGHRLHWGGSFGTNARTVRDYPWKMIVRGKQVDPGFENHVYFRESNVLVYNLKDDPYETHNLYGQNEDIDTMLQKKLNKLEMDSSGGRMTYDQYSQHLENYLELMSKLSSESKEKIKEDLRALGYL